MRKIKKFKDFINEALLLKPTKVLNKPKPLKTLAIKKPVVAAPTVAKPNEFEHRQAQVGAVKKLKSAKLLTKKKPGLSEALLSEIRTSGLSNFSVVTSASKKPVVAPTVTKPDELKPDVQKKPGLSEAFSDPNTHPMSPLAAQHGFEHKRSQGMLNAQVHVYENPKTGSTLHLKTSSGMGMGGQQHSFSLTDAGGDTKKGSNDNELRSYLSSQNRYV